MKNSIRACVYTVFAWLLAGFSTHAVAQTQDSIDSTTSPPASTIPSGGKIVGNGQGLGTNEISLGNAIQVLCPNLVARRNAQVPRTPNEADLQQRCTEVVNARGNGVGASDLNNILRELNVDEAAAQNRGLVELSAISTIAVAGRLQQLRVADAGQRGETVVYEKSPGQWGYHFETGGAAGDEDFGRWSVYLNGEWFTGDRDQSALEAGFDLDGGRITVGTDYRLNDNTFVGGSLDYITSGSDFDNGSNLDSDGFTVTLYGTKFTDTGLYYEGTIGFGFNDYNQDRRFTYTIPAVPAGTTTVTNNARGDTEGNQIAVSAGVGKDMDLGNGLLANFTGHLNYLDASIDGFTETVTGPGPGVGMGLVVGDQDISSLRSSIGAQISKSISTETGVIVPFARADWLHEFDNDSRTIIGSFVNDPFGVATTFALTTDEPDKDYFRIGGGLSTVFAGGLQGFVALDTFVGLSDLNYYSITAGISKEL